MYKKLTLSSLSVAERIALRNARLRSGQCIRCFQSSRLSWAENEGSKPQGDDQGTPYNAPQRGLTRQQRAAIISEEVQQIHRGQSTENGSKGPLDRPAIQEETVDLEAARQDTRPGAMGDNTGPGREGPTAQEISQSSTEDGVSLGDATNPARVLGPPTGRTMEPSNSEEAPINAELSQGRTLAAIEDEETLELPELPQGYSWLQMEDPVARNALPSNDEGMLQSPIEGAEILMAIRDTTNNITLFAMERETPATATDEADTEYFLYNCKTGEQITDGPLVEAVAEAVEIVEDAQERDEARANLEALRNPDGSLKETPLPEGYVWLSKEELRTHGLTYTEDEGYVPKYVESASTRGFIREPAKNNVYAVIVTPEADQEDSDSASVALLDIRTREMIEEGELVEAAGFGVQVMFDAAEADEIAARQTKDVQVEAADQIEEDSIALPHRYSWLTETESALLGLPNPADDPAAPVEGGWEVYDYVRDDQSQEVFTILQKDGDAGDDEVRVEVAAYNHSAKQLVEGGELVTSIANQMAAMGLRELGDGEGLAIGRKGAKEELNPVQEAFFMDEQERQLLDQHDKTSVGPVDFRHDNVDKRGLLQLGQYGSTIAAGNFEGVIEDRFNLTADPARDGFRHPPYLAQKMVDGQLIRFKSQEEKEAVLKAAKKIAERRARNISEQKGGEEIEPINYEFAPLPDQVQTTTVEKMIAGKYDANGLLDGKSKHAKQPVLDEIARMNLKNGTYLSNDGERFLKKVQSLLPTMQQAGGRQKAQQKENGGGKK